MNAAYLRAEAEWLEPPCQPDPVQVRISCWISVFPEEGKSPEECIREQVKDRSLDLGDCTDWEYEEMDGAWPVDESEC